MSEKTAPGVEEQLVVFMLANECYGVDIARVHEIIRLQAITKVPRTPAYVEGIINLRGRVNPVVDLRHRLDLPVEEPTSSSRIVIVEMGGQTLGLIVDAVSEVLRISSAIVEPPSSILTSIDAEYIRGIAKLADRLVILLDLEKVMSILEPGAIAA